ncbi:DUF397 domain-containing protein [Spirillospora sp. NPDC052269]
MSTLDDRATWRRSSHSGNGGNCVEVAGADGHGTRVRDSTDPDGPSLTFSPEAWRIFRAHLVEDDGRRVSQR